MNWLQNKYVQILIVVLVIIGICMLAKLNLHGNVGSNGINVGVDRGAN